MKVLVIAPHPDDEILGCGGVMAKHAAAGDEIHVVIGTSSQNEAAKAMNLSEAEKANKLLGVSDVRFLDFPTVELPHISTRLLTDTINGIVKEYRPNVVYIPFYGDMHTDHRMIADAAMVAVRPVSAPFVNRILAYETLSETGWNYPTSDKAFIPNCYVDISEYIDAKIAALHCYERKLQPAPKPRSIDGIRTLAKYRGQTIGIEYAESFMIIRDISK